MPKGPSKQRRPADVIGCAVMCAQIATGEVLDIIKSKSGRTKSGKAGAKARAKSLTKEQRKGIAQKAALARWR